MSCDQPIRLSSRMVQNLQGVFRIVWEVNAGDLWIWMTPRVFMASTTAVSVIPVAMTAVPVTAVIAAAPIAVPAAAVMAAAVIVAAVTAAAVTGLG
jgi:hypothetical protein